MLISLHNSLFGFLLGSTLAGASVYYYILEEYKVSNELLTEDIYVRCSPSHKHPPTHTDTKPRTGSTGSCPTHPLICH
jgi:hypothetical protein